LNHTQLQCSRVKPLAALTNRSSNAAVSVALWELWERSIRPFLVPRAGIDALSVAMLVPHADRTEQTAFIQQDRAWRYFR
jgi:hypothetical protein